MAKTTLPLGITIPIRLGSQGYFEQSFDTNTQIKSNLLNFFLTKKGERPFNPTFGSDLWSILFNNKDADINDVCLAVVQNETQMWFPMIDVKKVEVNTDAIYDNQYAITARIFFLNDRFEQNMDFVDVTFTNTIV